MSVVNKSDLDCLIDLFKEAEGELKSTENDVLAVDIPSINELRYAGYHLIQSFAANKIDHISKAEKHCKRAIYDVHELHITDSLTNIRTFQDDYRTSINITSAVPDYARRMVDVRRISLEINEIRKANKDDRDKYYKAIAVSKATLMEISDILLIARDEINKKDADDENVRIKTRRWNVFFGFIFVLTLLAAAYPLLS